jgi:hypothetical protein
MMQNAISGGEIWQSLFRPLDQEDDVSLLPRYEQEFSYSRAAGIRTRYLWTSSPLVMSNPIFSGPGLSEDSPCARSTTLQPTCPTGRAWSSFDKFRQTSAIQCILSDIRLCSMVRRQRMAKQPGIRSLVSALISVTALWVKLCRCEAHASSDVPCSLHSRMRTTLLHALPVINYPQFEQACKRADGAGPIPYALLAATMAHAASYMPTLRPLHQSLWAHVLNALDAEFRQPRLQTLQLSMLLLSSRPGVNFAQSDITLSRVSLAQDQYLQIDNWRSPRPRPAS